MYYQYQSPKRGQSPRRVVTREVINEDSREHNDEGGASPVRKMPSLVGNDIDSLDVFSDTNISKIRPAIQTLCEACKKKFIVRDVNDKASKFRRDISGIYSPRGSYEISTGELLVIPAKP